MPSKPVINSRRWFRRFCQNQTDALQQATPLFDHLVGTQQEHWRDCHAECARGLQVYGQLEFGWLLDRQVGWPSTAQNFVDERDDMSVTQQLSRSIGEQPPILRAGHW